MGAVERVRDKMRTAKEPRPRPRPCDALTAGSAGWNARACGTGGYYTRNASRAALSRATDVTRIAQLAADPLRFRFQFSALLLLQRPAPRDAPDVTLFHPHMEVSHPQSSHPQSSHPH
jgi:hypothetical protein